MRRVVLRAAAVVGALACAPAAGAWTWPAGGAVLQPFVFDPAAPIRRWAAPRDRRRRRCRLGGACPCRRHRLVRRIGTDQWQVCDDSDTGRAVRDPHSSRVDRRDPECRRRGRLLRRDDRPQRDAGGRGAVPFISGIRVTAQDQGYLDPLAFLPPRVGLPPPAPEAEASSAAPAAEADAGAVPPVAEPEPAPAEPLAATAEEVADSTFLQPVTDSPPKPAPPDIVAEPGAAAESSVGTASPAEEPVDAATMPDPQPEPEAPPVEAASPDAAPVAVAEAH